jgi:eukaryotic-like serine/threonine-protein kinase
MTLVAIGDILAGKYRVEKVLGIGGMGMVVAAMHLELDQEVALKFMLPEAMASAQAMDRFLREARAAVRLRSEHICRVLDVGRLDNGAPYIVMELMEGRDFAHVIAAHGAMPVTDAVDHVIQAMEGLAEAHAQGIVHRDLKPGNLFVTIDNEGAPLVKVLDFGISKSSLGGAATKTGDIMGSPAYMAPEQMASSKDVDARADIWALGVILYQAITGGLPFEGDTLPALCMSVLNATPPAPSQIRAGLPPGLADVVMRCLEKQPDRRYASVAALAEALAPFGSAEAAVGAKRIAKVLRRSATGPATALPTPATGSLVAPTIPPTVAPLAAGLVPAVLPAPVGANSTLQSSAAELAITPAPPKQRRLGMIAGVTVVVAAVVLIAVVKLGKDGGTDVTPAATLPPPSPPPAAPIEPATAAVDPPAATEVEPVPVAEPPPATPVAAVSETPKPVPLRPKPERLRPRTSPAVTVEVARPAETKPVEATKPEAKPAETKPAETKPVEAKPTSKWTRMQHDKK